MSLTSRPLHLSWLERETLRLLDFGRAARCDDGGFGWLDSRGGLTAGEPRHLYVTGRMTHAYALGELLGVPGSAPLADHGVTALTTLFHDDVHGGWFTSLDAAGRPLDDAKASYPHSFVVLASASASIAGRPGARDLLDRALDLVGERFWLAQDGAVSEQWDRTFHEPLDYRGLNSNMHMLEALLAAWSATGSPTVLDRARQIGQRGYRAARDQHWRLPEHFTTDWEPLLDYNSERRDDPFKPYGSTIGHWFEWARLLLLLESALEAAQRPAEPWIREAATALFALGVTEGWHVDGAPGFVYTVDWQGVPGVRTRLHWVVAEAIGAAATLHSVTGEEQYERWYHTWWDYARDHLIDPVGGSWHHELDPQNRPASLIKEGKADIYHALQATLIPRLPVRPSIAQAVADSH